MEGLYSRARIWRMMNSSVINDSPVGGALMSGTIIYEDVRCSFQDAKGTQALYEQGLETLKMVDCIMQPQTLDVQERDEIEVTYPTNHWYYGKRLRVIEVLHSGMHPDNLNGHLELKLQRITRGTRRNQ